MPIVKEDDQPQTAQAEESKPWYMRGGTRRPKPAPKNNNTGRHTAKIWPQTEEPWDDRITNQLMFVPPDYSGDGKLKKIVYYYELPSWHKVKLGREAFIQDQCPVDTCTISVNKAEAADADAIIFWDNFKEPKHARPPKQVSIVYCLYLLIYSHLSAANQGRIYGGGRTGPNPLQKAEIK